MQIFRNSLFVQQKIKIKLKVGALKEKYDILGNQMSERSWTFGEITFVEEEDLDQRKTTPGAKQSTQIKYAKELEIEVVEKAEECSSEIIGKCCDKRYVEKS